MTRDPAAAVGAPPEQLFERMFTVAEANRALVLIDRVIRDIRERFEEFMRLRREAEGLANVPGTHDRVQRIGDRLHALEAELNALSAEIDAVGCVLKDWQSGLVDFPAMYEGRMIWLCWRHGEPAVAFWHEYDAGFRSRVAIDAGFESKLAVASP